MVSVVVLTFRILVGTVGRGVVVLVGRRGVLPWNMITTRVTMLHLFLFYFHERFFQLKNTSLPTLRRSAIVRAGSVAAKGAASAAAVTPQHLVMRTVCGSSVCMAGQASRIR